MSLLRYIRKLKREVKITIDYWKFHSQSAEIQRALDEIVDRSSPDQTTIIFLPGLSWDRQLQQRPQHLASALARQGALVFYIEPDPQFDQIPIKKIAPNLYWCQAPIQFFRNIPSPWVYMLTWSLDFTHYLDRPNLIYDLVDDLSAFKGDPREIIANHRERQNHARLILFSARRLLRSINNHRQKSFYCPNAVDYGFFNQNLSVDISSPLEAFTNTGRPIMGYCGAFAHWFDYDLLREVAQLKFGYDFVLVGPKIDSSLDESGLVRLPNIYWLGEKPYTDIPAIMTAFDVGLIPFRLNAITHAASPLKLFEYFATGTPVVITPMEESMQYPGVFQAETPKEFAGKLEQALSAKNDERYIQEIKRVSLQNTWEERAKLILHLVQV